MRSARSNTVTACPARVSCCAAARPAGPLPTTATRLPVAFAGTTGTTQPSSNARSTISTSICLIVTGGSLMPSTHAASQGAGHRRPVNSGKLFVACNRSLAPCQRSWYTRSFHSGMRFPSGQPVWQKGMPQSMQRAPWVRTLSAGKSSYSSFQSSTRTGIGRRFGNSRSFFIKPVVSPTGHRHHRFVDVDAPLERVALGLEHPLEVLGEDLRESLDIAPPRRQDLLGDRRARELEVHGDERAQRLDVLVVECVDVDHLVVHTPVERAVRVPYEREAATHSGREIAAGRAEDDRAPAGHVLASVIADAFDDRRRARVAHTEALADEPADERVPIGGAVQNHVAGDDVVLGDELGRAGRPQHQRAARQTLAEVVVGVAFEP